QRRAVRDRHRGTALARQLNDSPASSAHLARLPSFPRSFQTMSMFSNPFDADKRLGRACECGHHDSQAAHDEAEAAARFSDEAGYTDVVASAVTRALFPHDLERRAFLKAVGASSALAAISAFFPLATATDVFAQTAKPEKTDLKIGFIPITCATPI